MLLKDTHNKQTGLLVCIGQIAFSLEQYKRCLTKFFLLPVFPADCLSSFRMFFFSLITILCLTIRFALSCVTGQIFSYIDTQAVLVTLMKLAVNKSSSHPFTSSSLKWDVIQVVDFKYYILIFPSFSLIVIIL